MEHIHYGHDKFDLSEQFHFMLLEDNDITCGGSNYHEVLNAYNALQ